MRASGVLTAALVAGAASAQTLDDPRLRVEEWANAGITRPACIAFVGPGELLVVENNDGRVLRVKDGVVQNTALDLHVAALGGLGIVVDPDFGANGYVYLYYATTSGAEGGAWEESRVVRATFDGTNLTNVTAPIFTVAFDPAQPNGADHDSGLLRFGPDGLLYGQVGDKRRAELANLRIEHNTGSGASSGAGGIFRLNPDGSIPFDNPFFGETPAGVEPWFVYGFRNSLGMDFDPITGTLWFGENGPTVYDEINRASPGMNSGWVKLMGPDARDATYDENGNTAFDEADLVALPGSFYRDPAFSFAAPIGITALCFLDSLRFDEDLRNVLLAAEFNFGQLYRFDLDAQREAFTLTGGLADRVADDATERDALRFGGGFGAVTDMLVGPDGYVYVVGYFSAAIHRIRPVVDLVEPATLTAVRGRLMGGSVADVEGSDERAVVLRSGGGAPAPERRILEARFVLNDPNPLSLGLTVEAHVSRPRARQRIEIWHVPSSTWVLLDERPATTVDQVVVLPNLSDPVDLVDPVDASVRVRIEHRSRERAGTLSPTLEGPGALTSTFDQLRIRTELP